MKSLPRRRPGQRPVFRVPFLLGLVLEAQATGRRERLYELVVQYPGVHLRELARLAQVAASHARYHLRVLEKTGRVSSVAAGRNLTFYPTRASPVGQLATVGPADRRLLVLLRRPAVLRIVVVLLLEGPLTLTDLAKRCGLTPPTVHHHLVRLAAAGLMEPAAVSDGKSWALRDVDLVRRLLATYEPPPAVVAGFVESWDRLSL